MGVKGISRHAAALQALGRYEAALEQWEAILQEDANHAAALAGKEVCGTIVQEQKRKQEEEKKRPSKKKKRTKKMMTWVTFLTKSKMLPKA